jgi:hypothetical protein
MLDTALARRWTKHRRDRLSDHPGHDPQVWSRLIGELTPEAPVPVAPAGASP